MTRILFASLFVLFVVRTDARAYRNAIWRDCTRSDSPVTLTNLDITPRTVSLPGTVGFTIEGFSNQTLGSSRMVIRIKTKIGWFNVPIPCIGNIGSCTYEDTCTLLPRMIRENWLGISGSIGSQIQDMLLRNNLLSTSGPNSQLCPQEPQIIAIRNYPLNLPRMPRVLTWFAEGLYRANVKVIDNSNNQELVCFDLKVNVGPTPAPEVQEPEEECSGYFGCWFGGK